jgi:alcohol dehydrogenase class IV
MVIGFGGGSAIDTGKAIAILLRNPGKIEDYLEVIGKGKTLPYPGVAMIAIPTTAGTGAEVTRNAVLGVPEKRIKVSLRSPFMLPKVAFVDPELTYDLPAGITASTGLDALTQLIEPFVSNSANPMTDAFCREGLLRAARSLKRVFSNGRDIQAREDMSLASLFGGLALANARLGAVHGFAGVLGGRYSGPHGAICAKLLPPVMETNLRALRERSPESEYLLRYQEVARILTGSEKATEQDGLTWVKEACLELQIPPLSVYGFRREDIPTVVEMSTRASSMKGNPITLTSQEMESILIEAL